MEFANGMAHELRQIVCIPAALFSQTVTELQLCVLVAAEQDVMTEFTRAKTFMCYTHLVKLWLP